MRPEAPFYVGTTRPSWVGWTRIALTLLFGAVLALVLAQRGLVAAVPPAAGVFALLALWTWMGQHTRFIVDDRGLTVSLGGFLPRPTWPLAGFRTVQYRIVPQPAVGASLGGYGWRRGMVIPARPEELRPVGDRKLLTGGEARQSYRMVVTRPGTMVEIVGREGTGYLLTPEDPEATAAAIDQAIRARR
ncbi:glycosyltransferase [Brachybacterium sp. GCM10030252]|uniref:glycosyltransferase n=1 Tax=Brachybacterium sp. GCM10030252 TaxID=3273380 RepID=UPI003623F97F